MSAEEIITGTTSGPVRGRTRSGVHLFAGIPYAAPPVGSLRFRPPQPHPGWGETRDARKFGPAAPQVPSGGLTDAANVRWDEDCLTLNVQTPAIDDAARPVLVWIHGGGYRTGQGAIPWYNGQSFCAKGDIVVVTINYRLGALGFTDLSRFGSAYDNSGALGTLDQIAALEWVRDNIARFGGDPAKVTIAGESAGGFSVSTLLGCEAAQGLFRAAIPQSGGAQHTLTKDQAHEVTDWFLAHLGVDDIIGLEAASADAVLEAQVKTIKDLESGAGFVNKLGTAVSPFYPVHGTPLLPVRPLKALRQGVGSNVPVLTGSNQHETTLWGYGKVDEGKLHHAARKYGAEAPLATYLNNHPDDTPADTIIRLTTDHMFRIPAIRLAEAREAHGANTWMYLFSWESRAFKRRLKATHALEIPFAFNNLSQPGVDAFLGPGEVPQHVADDMHAAWTRFVRDLDPGWPAYESGERLTYRFDDEAGVISDPDGAERQAWEGIR